MRSAPLASLTPLSDRRVLGWPALAALVAALAPLPAEAARPVVAVFDIYDARTKGKFAPDVVQQLNTYLLAKLAEAQTYQVVPREQVLAAISAAKKDTYKACVDEKCQIELGKELAAEKSLGTQIIRIGDKCVVTSTLYDLKTAVSEGAATKRAPCDQDAMLDALDAIVEQLSAKGRGGVVGVQDKALGGLVGSVVGEGQVVAREEPRREEPKKTEPVTAPDRFADVALPATEDGRLCGTGDGNACSRVAKSAAESGQPRTALKAADRGCNLGNSVCCQWAAKVSEDQGDRTRALEYARTGCNLRDGGGCAWTARLENSYGSKAKALEAALRGCNELSNGGACAWAANVYFGQGDKAAALDYGQRGCRLNDGEACSWVIKVNYENGARTEALAAASRSCNELRHAGSCSWAGTICYESSDKARALDFSTRGCELGEIEACGWNAKINYELGNKQRALDVASRSCTVNNHPASCSWATQVEYDFGNLDSALRYAIHGCRFNGPDACSWQRKIEAERGR
ncbi:hypothetical protein L6R52_36515 [Myxococcota bacterium]|nr:hypothetical protein [Myxococcota bacterium]